MTRHGPLRHFLEIDDVTASEIEDILDRSEKPYAQVYAGKGVGLIFEKPSLRTRNSSEMAVVQLGGHPTTIYEDEIGLDVRESVEDATRTLHGYYAVLCARVFEHRKLERMSAVSQVPIVNLLSDDAHPVQALADLLTIRQSFGSLAGRRLAWIGDFSNVARSLAIGLAMCGGSVRFACPPGYGPSEEALDRMGAHAATGVTIEAFKHPADALDGADVVSTDAWYSMGQESQMEIRRRAFEGYCVDERLMALAASNAIFLHCLPAHRGEEASDGVLDGTQSRIWSQAHNRMHTMRGLFSWLDAVGAVA